MALLSITPGERRRMVDVSRRFGPKLALAYAFCAVVLVAAVPVYGWWIVALIGVDSVKTAVMNLLVLRSRHPERWLFPDFVSSIGVMAVGIWGTGGAASPFLPWMAIFAALLPALFSRRLLRIGTGVVVVATAIAAVGPESSAAPGSLIRLGAVAAMVLAVGLCSHEMMRSETRHRSVASIDPLTGLPNRRAFESRLVELDASGQPASFIVADIDHFKRVNDEHGHDRGDAVLVAVADELRRSLRVTDLPYRVGGEEFVFVLPLTGADDAAKLAEMLRVRFERSQPADLSVTMSFGVATSTVGGRVGDIYRAADQALLRAKRGGRNRVEVDRVLSSRSSSGLG